MGALILYFLGASPFWIILALVIGCAASHSKD